MTFAVEARFTRPLAVLRVRGELDVATASQVTSAVAEAMGHGCQVVALDLRDVSFIDCTALGILVAAKHDLDRVAARLELHEPSHTVSRLLSLAGMEDFFPGGRGKAGPPARPLVHPRS